MSLVQIAAIPKEIEVGGKIYKLSILSLGDWAKIYSWAEDRFFEDMGRRLKVLPEGSEAHKELANKILIITRAELLELAMPYTRGSGASAYQLWLMLKHNHPDISLDEAQELISFKQFLDLQEEMLEEEGDKETAPPPVKS
jgi:hypothetical protein